jgi:two-component system response regulator AtoC
VHVLPLTGTVTLGRGDDCEVPIDDASVSRRHARIVVTESGLTIEDLGSANGTRIRRSKSAVETAEVIELRLERGVPTAFALDEPVTLGSVTLLVRPEVPAAAAQAGPTAVARASRGEVASDIVQEAEQTKRVFDLAGRLAAGPLNLLLTGETGAGKEVLAAHIHRTSPRAKGPFVEVNCAALTESLAESELFGHQKGAFTGAVNAKEGFFEAADGGTLFLDEVGELALPLQAKLLRVLETKKVLRVGATTPTAIDVRVLAATHRDLPADVKSGKFRQDLYFRLNGMTVSVPPLRERRADIAELARRFAARTAKIMNLREPELEPAAVARLEAHAWPGNVRELRNVMDRAVALAGGHVIGVAHLFFDEPAVSVRSPSFTTTAAAPSGDGDLRESLDAEEKRRILEALAACDGNQTKAAEQLGMPRRTFVARLQQYGLTKPRKPT